MPSDEASRVTRLLEQARAGDPTAEEQLAPLLYRELRELARAMMGRERDDHTLQPTALVHEAWLKISAGGHEASARDRQHFLAIAAGVMRQVLVDHARRRRAQKRGGDREPVPLDDAVALLERGPIDLLVFDETLARLAENDAQLARIVELRFFGGLTLEETGRALGLSRRQVDYAWSLARAWLHRELARGEDDAQ